MLANRNEKKDDDSLSKQDLARVMTSNMPRRCWLVRLLGGLLIILMFLLAASPGCATQVDRVRGGWYPWKPYQFLEHSGDSRELSGLDVRLFREIFEQELGASLELPQLSWDIHQLQLQRGESDVAGGAFKTEARSRYAFFSDAYRTEDVVLVSRRHHSLARRLLNQQDFLKALETNDLRLGVVKGYSYGDAIDAWLRDPAHNQRRIEGSSVRQNLDQLIQGKVDLVAVDRLVGAAMIWEQGMADRVVIGHQPVFSGPIVALFSRKSTTPELLEAFNQALQTIRDDGRYNQIVRDQLFPTLLGLTADQPWFTLLETIGTAAFAFSGVLLARRERFSLYGAFVLASLPAVGGGLMRDVIANRPRPAVLLSSHHLLIVALVVVLSSVILRFSRQSHLATFIRGLEAKATGIVQVLDAVGLASFTVVGVIVAVEEQCEPLLLWGPIFSAMTGAGGAILRDIMRADASHPTLRNELYAEISLFWGLILSWFIMIYSDAQRVNLFPINTAVVITALGCLLTRLLVIQKGIQAPSFVRLDKIRNRSLR